MSDLDDKLHDIIIKYRSVPAFAWDEAISELKQVFTDAGYIRQIDVTPIAQTPYKVEDDIEVKDNVIRIRDLHLMTGQAWYDRFKAELDKQPTISTDGGKGEALISLTNVYKALNVATNVPEDNQSFHMKGKG